MALFSQIEVEAIANALGDTELGLTGSEIGHVLQAPNLQDPDPSYALSATGS